MVLPEPFTPATRITVGPELLRLAMGMLNAEERFGVPALAPAMFNVMAVAWGLGLWSFGLPPGQIVLGWSLGTLLGGLAQFLIQVPARSGRPATPVCARSSASWVRPPWGWPRYR